MADFPMELTSTLGAAGLAPIAVPIANIAIERRFSQHLEVIESRTLEASVSGSPNPRFDSANTVTGSDSTDSSNTIQHDSTTDASNGKTHSSSNEVNNEGAEARADTEAENGAYANVAGLSGRASSGDTNPSSEPVRGKVTGEAQLTAKPGPEHQKQQKLHGVGLEQETEKQDFDLTPADPDADASDIPLSNEAQIKATTETLGIRVRIQGRESRKNFTENAVNERENGDAMEVTGSEDLPLENDATPAVRQTRRNNSKLPSNIHATTAVETPSLAAESVSPETGLITQVRATDPSPGESQSKNHDSQPPSDVLPENANGPNDRPITAPTLLSSRLNESGQTQNDRDGLSDVERVRFVQRVARAFHSIGEEGGEIQLRLRPPELGSLRLEIAVRDGVMTAQLETETTAARNILLDNLPQLRERLAEQSVKVERFDVNVRDDAQQRNDQTYEGQTNLPRSPRRGGRSVERSARPVAAAHAIGPRTSRGGESENLNVVI